MPQQSRYRTGDQAFVRQMNLSVIMHHLRECAPISRASLADITGLNKTTVSSLVQELIQQHFVQEFGLNPTRAGRPAMLLTLNPSAGFMVAAEIGVDFISVIRTNFAAEITWRRQEPFRGVEDQVTIIERLLDLVGQACNPDQGNGEPLLGIAVGVPGLVEQETGELLFAPNLGWEAVPLRALLGEHFLAPIVIDNEANLAALGECYFGEARGHDNVLYISSGIGVGGGLVHSGRLYRGANGYSGEFGHMTMDPSGQLCRCGNRGCWETQASLAALVRYSREAIGQGQPSWLQVLSEGNLNSLSFPMIVVSARAGDAAARTALAKIGRALGVGIASLVNGLNPDLVVLGGMMSAAGDLLLPAIEDEIEQRALRWPARDVRVVVSRYGPDACVIGGVAAILQGVLAEPPASDGPWGYETLNRHLAPHRGTPPTRGREALRVG